MAYTVAAGQLYQTEAVTVRIETGRLRVDGDALAERHTGRQIAVVQIGCGRRRGSRRRLPIRRISGFIVIGW